MVEFPIEIPPFLFLFIVFYIRTREIGDTKIRAAVRFKHKLQGVRDRLFRPKWFERLRRIGCAQIQRLIAGQM